MNFQIKNNKILTPILLKNHCLHCGDFAPVYKYCNNCITPFIVNNITYCNYCKQPQSIIIDGHCTACHELLLKTRQTHLKIINKPYVDEIIKLLGYKNYINLIDYLQNIDVIRKE